MMSPSQPALDQIRVSARLSRRTLLGGGSAGAVLWALGPLPALAVPPVPSTSPHTWRTWLLESGAELRPASPPAPSRSEIDELLDLQAQRTAATEEVIQRWGGQPAVLPWTNLALELITVHQPSPARAARALALLHVAIYDAVIATWDAQATYPRQAPSVVASALTPLDGGVPSRSAFPSEHAAVACAAVTVLTDLFPAEPTARLDRLAEEAGYSRLWAGTNYRSDVEAGFEIGRAVGQRAIARGQADGSDAVWDGSDRPTGEGYWQPTPPAFVEPPLDPLAGTWRTWVVPDVDALRPVLPPVYGSPAWQAELTAVQAAVAQRTPAQAAAVRFWAGGPGTVTPAGLWVELARDLVMRDGLDLPYAARVLALVSVALADAFICCWDAKYAYWTARPITADPSLDVLIPTPPFPPYTSGHSTISAAAATVLGHLFPPDAADLAARAREAKDSRLWAGIHFPVDNDMGAIGGRAIGRLVIARARTDDADAIEAGVGPGQ